MPRNAYVPRSAIATRAWAYDADLHCLDCTKKAGMHLTGARDGESNTPAPIMQWDELAAGLAVCGDCFEEL
jgi:hypothetical protein